jgi:hypothetical protein
VSVERYVVSLPSMVDNCVIATRACKVLTRCKQKCDS